MKHLCCAYRQVGPTHLANTLRLCSLRKGSILQGSVIILLLLWYFSAVHLISWVGTKTSKLYQMTMNVEKKKKKTGYIDLRLENFEELA